MGLHVHVDDSAHVHPFVMKRHVRAVSHNFERRAGRLPHTEDRNRIASENGIVSERIVGRDSLFAGRREQLHHRWGTTRSSVLAWRKQPRSEDVLARS